jgi:hypothetical protein
MSTVRSPFAILSRIADISVTRLINEAAPLIHCPVSSLYCEKFSIVLTSTGESVMSPVEPAFCRNAVSGTKGLEIILDMYKARNMENATATTIITTETTISVKNKASMSESALSAQYTLLSELTVKAESIGPKIEPPTSI